MTTKVRPEADDQRKQLIEDFLAWTGGFAPESDNQITVYLDYAAPLNVDAERAERLLRDWLLRDQPI